MCNLHCPVVRLKPGAPPRPHSTADPHQLYIKPRIHLHPPPLCTSLGKTAKVIRRKWLQKQKERKEGKRDEHRRKKEGGEQIKEVRKGGRAVAFTNTYLCDLVGKWMELHWRQIDGANFPALDQLGRLLQLEVFCFRWRGVIFPLNLTRSSKQWRRKKLNYYKCSFLTAASQSHCRRFHCWSIVLSQSHKANVQFILFPQKSNNNLQYNLYLLLNYS